MSIKTYTPEVKLSGVVLVERVCSFCKKSWKAQVKITATGRGDASLSSPDGKEIIRAREKAAQQLKQEEEKAKKQVDRGVALHVNTSPAMPWTNTFPTGSWRD